MNNYKASCGRRFWLVGIEPFRHWPPLARAVGHPEWIEDERFSDPAARAKNAKELIGELDKIFATRTLDEWSEIFSSEPDLFWAPVNTPDDLLSPRSLAPELGEHTAEILKELGLSEEEIESMHTSGVVIDGSKP